MPRGSGGWTSRLLAIVAVAAMGLGPAASAQEALQANNPIASATSLNIQNEYIGNLSGIDESANILNLRAVQPFTLFGGGWVARATLPVVTLPTAPDLDHVTGLSDFNVFALKLIDIGPPTVTVGLGPNLTVPSATKDGLGLGTWNAGIANVLFNFTNPKFQWGYLAVWDASFAKQDKNAPDQNRGFLQPFGIYQLGDGWYLRSTAVWNYNFKNNDYSMPIGFGAGRVLVRDKTVVNAFLEPQYAVASRGAGQREWGVFFGINFQLR